MGDTWGRNGRNGAVATDGWRKGKWNGDSAEMTQTTPPVVLSKALFARTLSRHKQRGIIEDQTAMSMEVHQGHVLTVV